MNTFQGELPYVRSFGFPVIEDNEVIAVQGAYQNITELKNAQKNESYSLTYLVIYSAS